MVKFTKRILLIALISCLLGAVLCVVAVCTGGFTELGQKGIAFIDRNGIDISGINLANMGIFNDDYEGDLIETTSLDDKFEIPVDVDEIDSLKIEVAAAKLNVVYSDDDKIKVGCSDEWYKFVYIIDGGELVLKTSDVTTRIGATKVADLLIEIPEELECEDIEMELAAGEFKLVPLQVNNNIKVELAAGTASFEGLEAENIELEVGAGDLNTLYMDTKNLKAEVGMGNLNINMSGAEKDYNYDVEVGMGNLDIGDGAQKSFLAGETQINNNADKNIELEVGMGNMTIGFVE